MTSVVARRRKEGCTSDLDLDEVLSGDLAGLAREAELRRHIEHCPICGSRFAARQADPALAPDPRMLRPLLTSLAASTRVRARWRWMGLGGAFGSAAVAGLVLWSHRGSFPDETSIDRTKGALALTVHVKRAPADGRTPTVEAVNGEGPLRAGEEMRFTIAAARPGFAVVLGLDGAPSVTVYVPAAGATGRPTPVEATRPVTLPGVRTDRGDRLPDRDVARDLERKGPGRADEGRRSPRGRHLPRHRLSRELGAAAQVGAMSTAVRA